MPTTLGDVGPTAPVDEEFQLARTTRGPADSLWRSSRVGIHLVAGSL
ncbi:MAG: hypothetical protein M3406_01910 [Chloroflexota bacterium]|nr:hypothetical protein [Chloroflexota bacterium]